MMNVSPFTHFFTNRVHSWRSLVALSLALTALSPAHGAVYTWTDGGGDNAWNTTSSASDWNPAVLPTTSDTVVFTTQGTSSPIAIGTASAVLIDFGGTSAAKAVLNAPGYTLGTTAGAGTVNIGAGTGTANTTFVAYFGTGNTATQLINANLSLGNVGDKYGWEVVNNAAGLLELAGSVTRLSTSSTLGNFIAAGSGNVTLASTSSLNGFIAILDDQAAGATLTLQGAIHLSKSIGLGNSFNGSFGNILLETDNITYNNSISVFAGAGGAGTLQLEGNLNLSPTIVTIADARFQPGSGGGSAHVENISGNTSIGGLSLANPNTGNSGSDINVQLDSGTLTIGSIATKVAAATATQTVYFYGNGNGNAVVSGSISDTGFAPVAIEENNASGTLTLQGANTYQGGTVLDIGTLVAANTQAFGVNGSAVTLNGGVLDLATDSSVNAYSVTVTSSATVLSDKATAASAGITQTLGSLSIGAGTLNVQAGANVSGGTPSVAFGVTTLTGGTSTFNPTTATVTLGSVTGQGTSGTNTIDLDGTSSGTISGAITDSGSGAATAIAKTNSSTWTLAGTNSNTGATAITAGTLILTGTLGSGQTTVTNATLEGNGTLTGALVVNAGGVLAPGNTGTGSLGTLSTASVTLAGTATLSYVLNSNNVGSSDLLDVFGSLTLNGATLSASDIGSTLLATNTTIDLANYTGALSGIFNGLADGSDVSIGVNTFQINYGTLDANEITLEAVSFAVPEPSTWGLLFLGLVLIVGRQFARRGLATEKGLR